ncbi:hypothetical protein BGX33_006777 [Mortierella sp. NVP41]|nr:hypothetical protein BGX33_006777 [Mortierella sp. NVP41]
MNFLLFKATAVFFVLQLPLLYGTWALFPIFGKERRRLGWTLSFYCAVFMIVPALLEFGHVRLTIYERLGLDAISLGLASPENATVFSEWAPGFLSRSIFGILAAAYFVGYVAGDLILGWIHYRDQIDPLSEWAYHIVYGILSWRHAIAKQISIFAICGGPLETELEKRGDAAGKTTNSTVVIGISTGSSSLAGGKKAIQLRMRIQEPNN